jgi:predicted transcriptional regulator
MRWPWRKRRPFEQHVRRLRHLAATGGSRKAMLREARAAYATAPNENSKYQVSQWLEPLEAGRVIRTKVVPATIITVMGTPAELVRQVEEVFKGVDER